jgi:hypothetical protein
VEFGLGAREMECEEFLADYSDFLDERFEEHTSTSYREHVLSCGSCAEYDRVVRDGLDLVRGLESPLSCPDILPLVKDRVLGPQWDYGERSRGLERGAMIAGLAAITLVVTSLLATLGSDRVTVELPPVVVEPAVAEDLPSLWGPAPRFTTSISLLQVPDLANDRLFESPRERLAVFRAPLRTASHQPPQGEQVVME